MTWAALEIGFARKRGAGSVLRTMATGAVAVAITTGVSAKARNLSAGVRGNPGQYFDADAYPLDALRAGEQGRVVARLEIDNTGRVIACVVKVSSGSTSLDATTCRIALNKITFDPATDRRGRAVASTYTLPVRWVLPTDAEGTAVGTWVVHTETVVDRDGVARSCTRRYNHEERTGADACAGFGPPLAAVIARLPDSMRGHAFLLVAETWEEVEGLAPPAPLDPELTVQFRIVEHFTVGADGLATECRLDPVSTITTPNPDPPCAKGRRFRLPDRQLPVKPLHVTRSATAAVRPLPDDGGI